MHGDGFQGGLGWILYNRLMVDIHIKEIDICIALHSTPRIDAPSVTFLPRV